MASTGALLLAEFRALINDTTSLWTDARCYAALTAAMQLVASQIPLGEAWVSSAFTVADASDTGTLPVASSEEYAAIVAMRRNSDGELLTKRTSEEMDRMFWSSQTAAAASKGDLTDYAMWETAAQVVTVRFNCPANGAVAVDLKRAILPVDLTTAGTEAVPLSRWAVHAIACRAAAHAVSIMHEFELKEMRLARGGAQSFLAMSQQFIRDEEVRRNQLDSVGRVVRFVR